MGLAENKAFFVRLWHAHTTPRAQPGQAGAIRPPHWKDHGSGRFSPLAKVTQRARQGRTMGSVSCPHQVP